MEMRHRDSEVYQDQIFRPLQHRLVGVNVEYKKHRAENSLFNNYSCHRLKFLGYDFENAS